MLRSLRALLQPLTLAGFCVACAAFAAPAHAATLQERAKTLDNALAVEDYPSILRVMYPLVPGGGKLAPVSAEENAFDIRWLQLYAPRGHVPLRYFLSWKLAASDPNAARASNALGRVGAMLDSRNCAKPVATPMYNLIESKALGDNEPLRRDEREWARAIDRALTWYGPGTNGLLGVGAKLPSATWLCGEGNLLPAAQAANSRAAYWSLLKKSNEQAMKGNIK